MKWMQVESGWFVDATAEWEILELKDDFKGPGWYWRHRKFLREKQGPFGTKADAIRDLKRQIAEWGKGA